MKPCSRCGEVKALSEFYSASAGRYRVASQCKVCARLSVFESAERNREAINARRRARRAETANPKRKPMTREEKNRKNRAYMASMYKQNPETFKGRTSSWKKSNPTKVRAASASRDAQKIRATPSWANSAYMQLWYDHAAHESIRVGRPCHVDHIVPLRHPLVCGLHNEFNLQVLTASENCSKQNRYWPDSPTGGVNGLADRMAYYEIAQQVLA